METIKELFVLTAPTLTAVLVVYFTFRYGVKLKMHEQKEEHNKNVKVTVSNLLLIWKEFSRLEEFLRSDDPSNVLVFKVPALAKKYLHLDRKKIKRLQTSYYSSLDNLKEIDVGLFFKLESNLEYFDRMVDEFLFPLWEDKEITDKEKTEIVIPLLHEILEDFEELIMDTVGYLPRKENENIKLIIKSHRDTLDKKPETKVPAFLIRLINDRVRLKEEITSDDLIALYNNEVISWFLSKAMTPKLIQLIFGKGDFNPFKLFLSLMKGEADKLEEFGKNVGTDVILVLKISEEEDQNFVDNKPLYHLVMGFAKKARGTVPFELKRILVQLNSGEISVREELIKLKKIIEDEKRR